MIVVEMAQITPPVGFNLFVIQGLTGKDIFCIAKAATPFFLILIFSILLLDCLPKHCHVVTATHDGETMIDD